MHQEALTGKNTLPGLSFFVTHGFMTQKKEILDEAFAGDIVGLSHNGNFKIGDTL